MGASDLDLAQLVMEELAELFTRELLQQCRVATHEFTTDVKLGRV